MRSRLETSSPLRVIMVGIQVQQFAVVPCLDLFVGEWRDTT